MVGVRAGARFNDVVASFRVLVRPVSSMSNSVVVVTGGEPMNVVIVSLQLGSSRVNNLTGRLRGTY